jgi:hypothetical protein
MKIRGKNKDEKLSRKVAKWMKIYIMIEKLNN